MHDRLLPSYAVMLEEWGGRFGLSRGGALMHAQEFAGLYDDVQELLMQGYSLHDHEAITRFSVFRSELPAPIAELAAAQKMG